MRKSAVFIYTDTDCVAILYTTSFAHLGGGSWWEKKINMTGRTWPIWSPLGGSPPVLEDGKRLTCTECLQLVEWKSEWAESCSADTGVQLMLENNRAWSWMALLEQLRSLCWQAIVGAPSKSQSDICIAKQGNRRSTSPTLGRYS